MRVNLVLVFVSLALVFLTRCSAVSTDSERLKMAKLTLLNVSWTSTTGQNSGAKRFLRVHDTNQAQRVDKTAKDNEERVTTVGGAVNFLGNVALKVQDNLKQKIWLGLGYTPDQVMILLNVVSKEDEAYQQYVKYFYRYFVKYLDEPISQFSPRVVNNIWNARIHSWLETDTPPQVFKKLGLTGPWSQATGQKNYKYFEKFYDMWSKKQVRDYKNQH